MEFHLRGHILRRLVKDRISRLYYLGRSRLTESKLIEQTRWDHSVACVLFRRGAHGRPTRAIDTMFEKRNISNWRHSQPFRTWITRAEGPSGRRRLGWTCRHGHNLVFAKYRRRNLAVWAWYLHYTALHHSLVYRAKGRQDRQLKKRTEDLGCECNFIVVLYCEPTTIR